MKQQTTLPKTGAGLLFALLFLFLVPRLSAQNTCSTAINFPDGQISGTYADTVIWYEFTASYQMNRISLNSNLQNPNGFALMQLYSGSCTSLTLIGETSPTYPRKLILADLIIGNSYMIKLKKSSTMLDNIVLERTANNPPAACPCSFFPQNPSNTCNAICNGSFTSIRDETPSNLTDFSPLSTARIYLACPWNAPPCPTSAVWGTSDVFSGGGDPVVRIPFNGQGYQAPPPSSPGYAGFYAGGYFNPSNNSDTREYITAPLNYTLQQGLWYTLSFKVNLSGRSGYAMRYLGAHLSNAPLIQPGTIGTPKVIPIANSQLQAISTNYISDTTNWTIITGTFQATGNEQYITIGQFQNDAATIPQQLYLPNAPSFINGNSYYFVTDVQLNPAVTPSITATPNPVCSGQPVTLTASLSPSASTNWTWTANSPNTTTCLNSDCSSVTGNTNFYAVNTYTASAVLSAYNNCTTQTSINVNSLQAGTADAGADQTVCLGQPVTLSGTASGTFTQTSWSTNLGTVCVGCTTVSITATSGLQYAVFSATNSTTGCVDTDTLLINLTQLQGVSLIPTLGYAANILCENVGYSVLGAPAGSQYIWSHTSTPAVSGTVTGLGQYTVNWSTAPVTSGNVTCTVIAPNGCTAILNLPVTDSCCYPAPLDRSIVLNNSNSAAFLSNILAQCPTCTVSGNTVTSPAPLSIAVHINGSFTINQNLILVNFGNIRMGTNAAIYIPAGKAFEMRTCTTNTYCGMMWDGIYVNGNTASFKATQNTLLQQAKNAVVSNSGGIYTIENTRIRNCLKGVIVNSYTAANHLGTIRSTVIEMPGTFLPASPALPTTYNKTLIGIEINNVKQIAIGDAATAAQLNTFDGIYKGIYAVASNTTVRNSRFINLPVSGSNPISLTGTGIHCEGAKGVPYLQAISVGGTAANQRCTFDNLRKGMSVNLAHNVTFVNNQITNLSDNLFSFGLGVSVQNCVGQTININSNRISNQNLATGFSYGVILTDVSGSTVNITNNRILQSASIASNYTQQKGIGIFVQNAIAAPVVLNIFNNDTIRRFMYGVAVANVGNTTQGFINQNRIIIDKPKTAFTQLHCGISIMNSTMIKADTNRIIRTSTPNWIASDAPSVATNLRGVYITNSQGCIVSDNTLTGMGEGVHGNGNCANTYFVCNVFQNSYRGFHGSGANAFNAVILNDQLTINNVGYPTGNSFTGSVTADLTGAIRNSANQAIVWYFSGTSPSSALGFGSLTNTNQPTFSSNPTQCANPIFLAPSSSNQREILAGSQIEISESTTADEMTKEMSAKDAHKLLVEHPDWLNLNTAQDGDYQQFFTETDTTEIAKANYTEIAALADNEQQAVLQNAALAGASDLTGNHKTVFEIYNRSWLKDSVALTAADSATLLVIALQHPAQGGDAVYTARVMLRIFVDDATGNYFNYRVAAATETQTPAVEVFPNPANNQITITGHYAETDVVVFSLYDLTGRIMLSEQLKTGNGTLNLDLGAVQPGVFLYQITVNGAVTTTDKLVIAR
jgi:Secretion system C-terminal sorting domain